MTEKKNEIVATGAQSVTPSTVLVKAFESGASIDNLTQLLELQERYEKREAEKAFNIALSKFKANAPKIIRDKHVKYGNTEYNHASLANVVYTISEELSKYGLSSSWETVQDAGVITVTCVLSHELGHEKRTALSANPDNSGGKNNIQAIGSAVSYLQRYTLLAITGLATDDQDNDAQTVVDYLSPEQIANIETLNDEVGGNLDKLAKYFNAPSLDKIPANLYGRVIAAIESKRAKK